VGIRGESRIKHKPTKLRPYSPRPTRSATRFCVVEFWLTRASNRSSKFLR